MTVDDERSFKLSNKCWICDGLFAEEDNKARDHYHVTGKYRSSTHGDCNINLKFPVIFHNLKSCDSQLIMQGIGKLNVKISVIPNGLEKYMAFTVNRDLVFIDSKQFINSSLGALVKNFSDNDFNYLPKEFSGAIAASHRRGELLKLVKQKGVYPYEFINSFERLFDDILRDSCEFYTSLWVNISLEKNIFMLPMFGICLK